MIVSRKVLQVLPSSFLAGTPSHLPLPTEALSLQVADLFLLAATGYVPSNQWQAAFYPSHLSLPADTLSLQVAGLCFCLSSLHTRHLLTLSSLQRSIPDTAQQHISAQPRSLLDDPVTDIDFRSRWGKAILLKNVRAQHAIASKAIGQAAHAGLGMHILPETLCSIDLRHTTGQQGSTHARA
jgi:hypothetical protein